MSRSRKKTPICGHASAGSDKTGKKIAWKKVRASERQALFYDEEVPHEKKIYPGAWMFPKDGKQWFGAMRHVTENDQVHTWSNRSAAWWHAYYRKLMRK